MDENRPTRELTVGTLDRVLIYPPERGGRLKKSVCRRSGPALSVIHCKLPRFAIISYSVVALIYPYTWERRVVLSSSALSVTNPDWDNPPMVLTN